MQTYTKLHSMHSFVLTKKMKTLLVGMISMIVSSACYCQKQSYKDSIIAHYDQLNHEPFAELNLEDTAGNVFNTASLKGKTVYVDFWFTACPPCIKEIPYSKELQNHFASD